MIRRLRYLDYSNHSLYIHESSTHQDKMEATSFAIDNFCVAPHGWSDSSLSESDDCDALPIELMKAFLSLKVFRL